MVEEAKRVLTKLFDYAEEQGACRISVENIRIYAVTNTGQKFPRAELRQARKELGIKSCSVGNTWYWEREKKDVGKNG